MSTFHEATISELRSRLTTWRDQLVADETNLSYREGQAAKCREVVEAARQRVADYERLLAVAEPQNANAPADAFAEYTDDQLDGFACISCGAVFASSESGRPAGNGPRGQLFVHSDPAACVEGGAR